jgi:hypothetical protein
MVLLLLTMMVLLLLGGPMAAPVPVPVPLPPGNTTMSCEYLTPGNRTDWHTYNGSMLLHTSLVLSLHIRLKVVNSTAPASGLRGELWVPAVFRAPSRIFNASCDLNRASTSLHPPRSIPQRMSCPDVRLAGWVGQHPHAEHGAWWRGDAGPRWNTNFSLMEPRQRGVPSFCRNGSYCPGGGQSVDVVGHFLPCLAPPSGPGGFRYEAILHFQSFGALRDRLCVGACCGPDHDSVYGGSSW